MMPAVVTVDTTAPVVTLTGPSGAAVVGGIVPLAADASDDYQVLGVRFFVDGVAVGAEDTVAPYAIDWNSLPATNGTHTVSAVARDIAGRTTASLPATVTVSNRWAGLVAAFAFNDLAGTAAPDSSGSGNHGVISGATWSPASGKFGGALSFDGVNDLVSVPDSASLDLTTAMTLEAWVRPRNLSSGYDTVLMKEVPSELSYALYARGATNRPSAWARTGGVSRSAIGTAALALNAWSHLAATYNGSSLVLYVNGAVAATRAMTGAMQTSNEMLRIGGNAVWGEFFDGFIDEVRVYNRALTQPEIQADMGAPVVAPPPTPRQMLMPAPASTRPLAPYRPPTREGLWSARLISGRAPITKDLLLR